jgi:F-type H+-transporting ATPase subunit b
MSPLPKVTVLANAAGGALLLVAAPAMAAAPAAQATHGETGAAAQGTEKEVFPPFDTTYFASTFVWLVITFVALYFVIWKLAIPRIGGILEKRKNRIEGDIAAAEKMKAESEAAAARYEKSLAEARAGGAKIAEAARGKARAAADAKRTQIEASLSAKLSAAETEIAGIKARALGEVGSVARDAAGVIVKTLAGIDVSLREVAEAVDGSMVRVR